MDERIQSNVNSQLIRLTPNYFGLSRFSLAAIEFIIENCLLFFLYSSIQSNLLRGRTLDILPTVLLSYDTQANENDCTTSNGWDMFLLSFFYML